MLTQKQIEYLSFVRFSSLSEYFKVGLDPARGLPIFKVPALWIKCYWEILDLVDKGARKNALAYFRLSLNPGENVNKGDNMEVLNGIQKMCLKRLKAL
jgi:hypothetical protein